MSVNTRQEARKPALLCMKRSRQRRSLEEKQKEKEVRDYDRNNIGDDWLDRHRWNNMKIKRIMLVQNVQRHLWCF